MKILCDELPEIVERYLKARQLSEKQQYRMRRHVERFDSWHKSRPALSEVETDSTRINAWLAELSASLAPTTVNGIRQSIISLWRFAIPDGDPVPRTDRIRRQRQPEKINPAFTLDEIRQLLAAAKRYKPVTERTYGRGICGDVVPRHRPDGVRWSVWWAAFVRIAYGSGQYLLDLRKIPWGAVGRGGIVSFVRHKTGRVMSFRLDGKAIKAAKRIRNPDLLLPWEFDLQSYFPREFAKFVKFAGVRPLGAKSLRRSAITYTYIDQGEEAARLLAGHRSFVTTSQHYIDWSIARRPIIVPRAI